MELKKLFVDDDAVSPVIGVILMVAITVILAAVIGAFVLGFGGGGPSAPSVSWETSTESNLNTSGTGGNDFAVFHHGGGDTIDDASVLSANGGSNSLFVRDGDNTPHTKLSGTDLSTGAELAKQGSSGNEITLIWNSPDSDSTQELTSHTI